MGNRLRIDIKKETDHPSNRVRPTDSPCSRTERCVCSPESWLDCVFFESNSHDEEEKTKDDNAMGG